MTRHTGSGQPRMRGGFTGSALVLLLALGTSAVVPPEAPVADAAMRGDVATVRSLLERGVDPNAAQGDGMTALHWAAERGHEELARVLITAGAKLEPVTRLGAYRPVHLAAKGGHVRVLRALLEGGASPTVATSTGAVTPMHFAATAASPEGVLVLLEFGADMDAREARGARRRSCSPPRPAGPG